MRWPIPFLVFVIAFVAVSCDQQPVEPVNDQAATTQFNAVHGVMHRVSVGGADVRKAGGEKPADANLSLVAIMRSDGSVKGEWQDSFGKLWTLHMNVDCLNVVGNEAWVSGVVRRFSIAPEFAGRAAIIRVADNGVSRNDPADQASKIEVEGAGEPLESYDCLEAPDLELLDMVNGQVTVR
jgi:hypothetical protein